MIGVSGRCIPLNFGIGTDHLLSVWLDVSRCAIRHEPAPQLPHSTDFSGQSPSRFARMVECSRPFLIGVNVILIIMGIVLLVGGAQISER